MYIPPSTVERSHDLQYIHGTIPFLNNTVGKLYILSRKRQKHLKNIIFGLKRQVSIADCPIDLSCFSKGVWNGQIPLTNHKQQLRKRPIFLLWFLIQSRILPYFPHSSVCLFVSQPWYLNFHRWFDGLDPENHIFSECISSRLTTWTTWTTWITWIT